jgi:uncharacterized protein (DUF1697 family)
MPNPWDLGSARLLARLGFPALATTSSGFAWSLGRRDNRVSLEATLGHLRSIAQGVEVPVNAERVRELGGPGGTLNRGRAMSGGDASDGAGRGAASSVVLLRAANVGGHQVFRPSLLARDLSHLGVINVGAAGTFVVPGRMAQKAVRAEFARRLTFPAEMIICRGSALLDLEASEPFPDCSGLRRFVSVMSRRPGRVPPLPLRRPAGNRWEVKVIGVSGTFALSLWRRLGRSFVDPNGVVEQGFGVRATTRNWNTILKICGLLRGL